MTSPRRIAPTCRLARAALTLTSVAALAFVPATSPPLYAQAAGSGRIEGRIVDSVRMQPLVGAAVLAVRVDPQPGVSGAARTDESGRYRIDSLPAGRYLVEFTSPFLDSLEITLPPREVVVTERQAARAVFALPSGATLRAAACPGVPLPRETGALIGQVRDADADRPLAEAEVAIQWNELSVDRAALRSSTQERSESVTTDSLGRFRLCGVPTGTWLLVQVHHQNRTGTLIRVQVGDSAGVAVRNLSLSHASSVAAESAAAARVAAQTDSSTPRALVGTSTVSGVVRGVGGLPLFDAQVRVLGAAPVARSDLRGRYSLSALPGGTQVLEVRRIGYLLAEVPVELRNGQAVEQEIRLQRIVSLDSMRIVAQRSRYREFEENRKRNGFGRFLDGEQLANRTLFELSDLFRQTPGFRVVGYGINASLVSSRGISALSGRSCEPNIVIDGIPNQEINLLNPASVGAIEIYRAGEPAPIRYEGGCGVVVIWTKR